MNDLTASALNTAQLRGASYADVRVTQSVEQTIVAKNGAVETLTQTESLGLGVRVLVDGAWGFAATHEMTTASVDQAAALAVQIARASARLPANQRVQLGQPVTSRGTYTTPIQIDPFTVSLEDKLGLLLQAEANMARVPGVSVRQGSLSFSREYKTFANTEGAQTTQTIYESGGGLMALAVKGDEVQQRSYPNSAERHMGTAGYEFVLAMQLPENAERIATEAMQLLSAAPCPPDTTTVILGGAQLALQIHESCGHPIELDRAFGTEADYAGGSFLTPEKLGAFRYGAEVVNLTADALQPHGLGTFGWDDEGVPAMSTPIVREGVFVGYLTSREMAARLGQTSNGHARAAGWSRLPLIRMANVSLEPGTWKLADLIADTEDGIFMETNRSWSIDDRRYNFQFGTEIGYEIKGGKLGRLLRDCTYTGLTPDFWRNCDAVCNTEHWQMWGTPNCGKGQPVQMMHTGHGCTPARFRSVRVGVLV